jgi:hypothetical protein
MDTDPEQQQPAPRERIGRRAWVHSAALVGGGLIVGAIIAGTVTATAADEGNTSPDSSTSQREDARGDGHRHGPRGNGDPSQAQRDDEELLTGDTATGVTDAVLAEYPDATIQRVETDSDGVYEAHIVTTEDEELTVQLDEDLSITGTESHGG